MGRTLFCDCCGHDIRVGNDLYRVDKIPISIKNEKDMFSALEKAINVKDLNPYIICADCFRAVGRKVQEQNIPIDIDIVVDKEK